MKKLLYFFCALVSTVTIQAATWNVTVPAGTKACYIAGELNGWSFQEMTKVDDTHYTITVETDKTDGYKYTCGPDWAYVEKTADGAEMRDRTYAEQDVVAKWASVYEPGVEISYVDITIRVQADKAPTIWWWGAGDKCPNAEKTYTWATQPLMTAVAGQTGWYEWIFKDVNASLGVTFKLNKGDKEIKATESACYNVTGDVIACPGGGDPIVDPQPQSKDTVFFVNENNWEIVKIHAWYGVSTGADWPGVDMTKADYQLRGADVYFFTALQGATGMCQFNCGGDECKTEDLVWTPGKYYYGDAWYNRAELKSTYTDITIRVKADAAPTIWWWGAGDKCPGAEQDYIFETQPAMKAVAGQEGWWEWSFKEVNTYTGVSFRLNGQKKEITAFESACYNLSGTRLFCPMEEIDPENCDTVFFLNTKKWENVKIHYWYFLNETKTEVMTTAWPGEYTHKADYRLKGADVYYYVLPAGFGGMCMFNDGMEHDILASSEYKTPELAWTPGMYYFNGTWRTYESLVAEYTDITIRVKADAAPAIWWWGAGNGCPDAEQNYTEAQAMKPVEGVDGWFEWTFADVDKELGVSFRLNDNKTSLTAYASACYDLDGVPTYCPGEENDPAKSDTVFFVNADKWETVKIHYWGGQASTAWPGVDMQKADYVIKGMEVYYYTVPKGLDITYCMFHCNSGNETCKTKDMDWSVGMYYYEGQWATREQAEAVPEVLLCGTMNKWEGIALVSAEDKVTASVVVALEKQEYQLKIKVDGAWMGNQGTMTRFNSQKWLFEQSVSYNMLLDADVAGDYQFVWTYADNTLSVRYPSIAVTAVSDAENADNAAVKIVRNGQVWILRGGSVYNIMGQEIK